MRVFENFESFYDHETAHAMREHIAAGGICPVEFRAAITKCQSAQNTVYREHINPTPHRVWRFKRYVARDREIFCAPVLDCLVDWRGCPETREGRNVRKGRRM